MSTVFAESSAEYVNNIPTLENLCRICITISDELIPIAAEIETMWEFCFDTQIDEDNGLPTKICPTCKEALEKYYTFKTNYVRNELFLKNLVLKKVIKQTVPATTSEVLIDHDYCCVYNESLDEELQKKDCAQKNFLRCKWCGRQFGHYKLLCAHIMKHTNDIRQKKVPPNKFMKKYECSLCFKKFKDRRYLLQHQKVSNCQSKIKQEEYSCSTCGHTYKTKFYLKYHEMKHQGEKNFTCSVCGMSFLLKQYLSEHFEIHEPGQYSCEICGKQFTRKVTLKRHRQRHLLKRKHICKICSRSFFKSGDLVAHMRVHTKEKPFKCTICERGFTQRGSLNKHMTLHEIME